MSYQSATMGAMGSISHSMLAFKAIRELGQKEDRKEANEAVKKKQDNYKNQIKEANEYRKKGDTRGELIALNKALKAKGETEEKEHMAKLQAARSEFLSAVQKMKAKEAASGGGKD